MAIGSFGRRIFTTSDSRILTFRDFSYTTTPRFAEHEIIGRKPKKEYLGPGIDSASFSVTLRTDMGIDVEQELDAWREMAAIGEVERLVIGTKRLGSGKWCLVDMSEEWNIITNNGRVMSASFDVTLEEYV